MMLIRDAVYRSIWLAATTGLVFSLLWLDHHRGGPASLLSRCNLSLSRADIPAADVLIVGSSRFGAALDPISMQEMLAHAFAGADPQVERIAIGQSPLRVSHALLENYLKIRGSPDVLILELMFETRRTAERLAQFGLSIPAEEYIFRRDLNLMSFEQIVALPSVAMPFTESEGALDRWRIRLRGILLRAGALTYEFLRRPVQSWEPSACGRDALTREPEWPAGFAFSYGSFEPGGPPVEIIETLESVMAEWASNRTLKSWQSKLPTSLRYPYDFRAAYRKGELALFQSMLGLASDRDIPVVLIPMPLYGFEPGTDDLRALSAMLPPGVHVFDLYGRVNSDLDKFWYDDAHIELYPAGMLTTAILAQHLLDDGLLVAEQIGTRND